MSNINFKEILRASGNRVIQMQKDKLAADMDAMPLDSDELLKALREHEELSVKQDGLLSQEEREEQNHQNDLYDQARKGE